MLRIYKDFTFDAAHRLTLVPPEHKCATMHGHTYRLRVFVTGPTDAKGMVIDYAELATVVEPLVAQVDHQTLNNVAGLENPTTEVLVVWLWRQINAALREYTIAVEVKESSTTGCYYDGK
jgi:6-pyruvoyltetrahydropterin/6-carboxytetrahydropterin synthase